MQRNINYCAGLGVAVAAVVMASAPQAVASAPKIHRDDAEICAWATRSVERIYHLPNHLLRSISLAESGRWEKRHRMFFAWPWTIRAKGKGRFFETKAQAAAEIRRLQRGGTTNIDVGCMQVNLQYHPKAFRSPEQALDPLENAEYAAFLLLRLHDRTRSWSRAVGTYHSGYPKRRLAYWRRVATIWQREQRTANRSARRGGSRYRGRRRAFQRRQPAFVPTFAPLTTPVVMRP